MARRVQGDLGSAARADRAVSRRRANLLAWAGIALSIGFAYLALRDVELDSLGDALREQAYVYLLPAGAVLVVGVLLRAWRWQVLFEPGERPPYSAVLSALLIGYLFNSILPARAGELARVLALGSRPASRARRCSRPSCSSGRST